MCVCMHTVSTELSDMIVPEAVTSDMVATLSTTHVQYIVLSRVTVPSSWQHAGIPGPILSYSLLRNAIFETS